MPGFDPILHQPTRLRIMVFLFLNRIAAVTAVRDALNLTDGNLATHLQKLEKSGFVRSRRALRALRFEVQVAITPNGSTALLEYVSNLKAVLSVVEGSQDQPGTA